MTVEEIVRDYLKENGYDGLCEHIGACACSVDDLAPCGEIQNDCEAGTRTEGCDDECGEGCKFHILKGKPAKGDRT